MATYKRTEGMDSSKSPRSSKSHHSRSRSRSRDRKRDKKHRQSRSRSKEGRRKDSDDRPSKSRKPEERQEQTERAKERLSESGDERHRRKGGASTRRRSRSRSRSRERHHRSRSRDRKRSRSRSRERRSRSRDRKRRARSRSRSRSKHRHRSRSRSKSRERRKRSERPRAYSRSRSRSVSPLVFQGRNTAMDAQEALARRYCSCFNEPLERAKKLQEQKEKEMLEVQGDVGGGRSVAQWMPGNLQMPGGMAMPSGMAMCDAAATVAAGSSILNMAAFLAAGTPVAPHIAMAAQMAALQAKALAETGAAVPSFYNPSAVNAVKLAEQDKKRKMLWQGKKEGDKSQTAELWEKLSFGNKDQNTKFRKLMGIKEEGGEAAGLMDEESLKTLRQQEEMFRNLDVQYEMARSQTHTQRGMGLGFSSSFASRGMDTL
ncbi:hypothetical protein ANANG_G00268530 [Anguilla anguilla]|uniref:Arginine/serine-rich coiled-coil protein 2 n=1 Tax=Anguilla anguilla TaxID=7936 RepID=A0A9D3LQJ6_ANGAN|nr:hypothetical protein ANANG_G00268530 [Anguilla anguilla]